MGRRPINKKAMTNAERQKAFQAKLRAMTPLERAIHKVQGSVEVDQIYTPEERARIEKLNRHLSQAMRIAEDLNQEVMARLLEKPDTSESCREIIEELRGKVWRITLQSY